MTVHGNSDKMPPSLEKLFTQDCRHHYRGYCRLGVTCNFAHSGPGEANRQENLRKIYRQNLEQNPGSGSSNLGALVVFKQPEQAPLSEEQLKAMARHMYTAGYAAGTMILPLFPGSFNNH